MTSTKGTNLTKDVIYIDVDDEVTGIIDKVRSSDKKIVALVLPKRATVLQSIVNMKLLKRAAGEAKKNLVLITSESGLMPLAGSVGIHVAKSLNSKPEVPDAPERALDSTESVSEAGDVEDIPVDGQKTLGELAGVSAPTDDDPDEAIELDDEDDQDASEPQATGAKPKRGKKFKIPDFNKFRVLLILAGVGVLLLGMVGYAAVAVWPKAKITIKTDSSAINSSTVLTLKTGADVKLDAEQGIIQSQIQEVKKTIEQQVPVTGQVNNGEKATGSVTLSLKDCNKDQVVVPAGTGVSSGGKTFITSASATLKSVKIGGDCENNSFPAQSTKAVSVVAQTGGASYNIGAASFTVAGYSNVTGSSSAAMTGGTDNITKVVSQADIDAAKQKVTEQDIAPIQNELKTALIGRNLYVLDVTMSIGAPETKLSAELNAPAETLTVTQTINYSMLGVKQDDLQKVIENDVHKKIDEKKQGILSYGLDEAVFSLQGVNPDGVSLTLQTTVVAGAELNADAIKKQVAGKKAGDAKELIEANPGVASVDVAYSPFWVSSIPKKTDKITVIIQEPQVTKDDTESSP